ncbi:MAG: hypothetical protein JSR37_08155 [Verrucomicrobia bacterium]|nr:hypothetical protein [Verrucomicrobiota bacterium]MBS0637994.1 hypothetical protein [Verrucomicrobiota bacterium]
MKEKTINWVKYAASILGSQAIYALLRLKCGYQSIEVMAAMVLAMFAVLFAYLETIKPTSKDKPLNLLCAFYFIVGILLSYHSDVMGYKVSSLFVSSK